MCSKSVTHNSHLFLHINQIISVFVNIYGILFNLPNIGVCSQNLNMISIPSLG